MNYKLDSIDLEWIQDPANKPRIKKFFNNKQVQNLLKSYDLDSLYLYTRTTNNMGGMIEADAVRTLTEILSYSGIDILDYLTSIPHGCFNGLNLSEVHIPSNIKQIGMLGFGFTKLKEITIPGNVKIISKRAFEHCTSLKTIIVEEGVEELNSLCFDTDTNTSIYLPNSINSIRSDIITTAKTFYVHEGSWVEQRVMNYGYRVRTY